MELQRKDIGKEKVIAVSYLDPHETINSLITWLQKMQKLGARHVDIGGLSDREGDIEEVTFQDFREYKRLKNNYEN